MNPLSPQEATLGGSLSAGESVPRGWYTGDADMHFGVDIRWHMKGGERMVFRASGAPADCTIEVTRGSGEVKFDPPMHLANDLTLIIRGMTL